MKKVITENGEVYYFKMEHSGNLGCLELKLYVGEETTVRERRKTGETNWFGREKTEIYEGIETKYKLVEKYQFDCSWDKSVSDYSLDTIKDRINMCIREYKKSNKNLDDLDNWDGYMGDEGARKKEIMRDQKIKDLLKGDTSKLEDFLNKD